jgi:hypothetical protein
MEDEKFENSNFSEIFLFSSILDWHRFEVDPNPAVDFDADRIRFQRRVFLNF